MVRRYVFLAFITFIASFTSACAPTTRQPEISDAQVRKEVEIQQQMAKDWAITKHTKAIRKQNDYYARGIDIWYRVAGANAPLCGKKTTSTFGALLAMAPKGTSVEEEIYRKANRLSLDYPTVLHVAAGSPADTAGLQRGDRILSANGQSVHTANFDMKYHAGERVRLIIRRNGKRQGLYITPEKTCNFGFTIKNKDQINAYATGDDIVIFTGIMDFAEKDEELALVISHEMAHNVMGHIPKKQGNAILGVILGSALDIYVGTDVFGRLAGNIGQRAYSQAFEGEADYVGVYFAARAGYDMSNAANIWRRMGAANPDNIDLAGSSHPSSAKRFLAIEETVREIMRKKRNKRPLLPEITETK
jgi:Zn-dependent protease with chaperone function